MLLPPIGSPQSSDIDGQICAVIIRIKQESRLVRETYEGWADLCSSYFHYGAATPPDDGTIIINDIQNGVITQTDIQTKEPPTITLEPVDTGEPPKLFAVMDPQIAAQIGLAPEEISGTVDPATGQPRGRQPLSPQSAMAVQQLIAAGQIPPTSLLSIGVTERADFFQKIFDVIWRRSNPEEWYWENTLWNNVYGWVNSTYEFDDDAKRHIFTNISLRQVFIDPTASNIEKAAYVIVDIAYDAEVAKALYPEFAEEIEQYADATGKIQRPPETLQMGSQLEDVPSFNRPMVTLTIAFLRDQERYLTPDEAIAGGHIESRQVPTGNWTKQPSAADPSQFDMAEEQREGYFHTTQSEGGASSLQEVNHPDHPDYDQAKDAWPTVRVVRQITAIATKSVVLDDCASQYYDGIPLTLNINIPILGKPFGIGEPWRLHGMQDGRSRILNAAVLHADWFKNPMTWSPVSAREQLPEEFQDGHHEPGMHFWIPDDLIAKTNGKPMAILDPPALPPVLMVVDDKLKRELNDGGGNVAALQGRPAEAMSQLSGVAIAQIQNGAASLSSFKARRTQAVVKRMARLAFHSILTRMSAADYGKIIKRYPPDVLEYLHQDALDNEWDINVVIAAGAGQMLQQKRAEAKDNFKAGLASKETTQEAVGLDPIQEGDRQGKELLGQARLQQQLQPPAPAPGNGPPAGAG